MTATVPVTILATAYTGIVEGSEHEFLNATAAIDRSRVKAPGAAHPP